MWAEEPSEKEETHSGYDKGAGNGAVEPGCKVESHQRTKESVDDGEPHDDRQSSREQVCRGAGQDEHGHDEDGPDGFKGADHNDRQ